MNKNSEKIAIIFLIIIIAFFCVLWNNVDRKVIRTGYVNKTENDIVKIVDTTGEVWTWECEERENFETGQRVRLVMNNNHTTNTIEDDIILKIKLDK